MGLEQKAKLRLPDNTVIDGNIVNRVPWKLKGLPKQLAQALGQPTQGEDVHFEGKRNTKYIGPIEGLEIGSE